MADIIIVLIVIILLGLALKGSIKHFKGEGPCLSLIHIYFDTTPSLASAKADTRIIIAFSSEKSRENLLIAFLFLS